MTIGTYTVSATLSRLNRLECFLAGLIGFLIGRGIPRKDAESIVKALYELLGFEPPVGLTGFAIRDMEKGKKYKSGVVVRGKTYPAIPLEKMVKYDAVSVLGKTGDYLNVARSIERTLIDTVDFELEPTSPKKTLALDEWGRLILSQVDYAHFEEKLAWNPLGGHFWHHFQFLPDAKRDIGHSGISIVDNHYARLPPNSYLFSHQQFCYGRYAWRGKIPKPATGVLASIGLFDTHIMDFAAPSYLWNNLFFRVEAEKFIWRTEGFGSFDWGDITEYLPEDCDTADHVYQIEYYEDLVRFWVDNEVFTTFPDRTIMYFPQKRTMNVVAKNEGTAGIIDLDIIIADPMPLYGAKADRAWYRNKAIPTTQASIYAKSCIIDKAVLLNDTEADIVAKLLDGEGFLIWVGTVPTHDSVILDLKQAFKWGIEGWASASGVYGWFKGAF